MEYFHWRNLTTLKIIWKKELELFMLHRVILRKWPWRCIMVPFSMRSIAFIVLGSLFFVLTWIIESYFEPLLLIGAIGLLMGGIFSFIAIFKEEKGSMKYISVISFFIILFLFTWFKPFEIIRIITWLKIIT